MVKTRGQELKIFTGNGNPALANTEAPVRLPRGSAAQRKRLLELRDELQAILTLLQRG